MDHTQRKITLLMSALIIGQAITTQNMLGMDTFGSDTTQENATFIYDFWSKTFASLYNPVAVSCQNTLHTGKTYVRTYITMHQLKVTLSIIRSLTKQAKPTAPLNNIYLLKCHFSMNTLRISLQRQKPATTMR